MVEPMYHFRRAGHRENRTNQARNSWRSTKNDNPIINEIREIRHRLALQFDNDVYRIGAEIRRGQSASGRRVVRRPRRKPVASITTKSIAIEIETRAFPDDSPVSAISDVEARLIDSILARLPDCIVQCERLLDTDPIAAHQKKPRIRIQAAAIAIRERKNCPLFQFVDEAADVIFGFELIHRPNIVAQVFIHRDRFEQLDRRAL